MNAKEKFELILCYLMDAIPGNDWSSKTVMVPTKEQQKDSEELTCLRRNPMPFAETRFARRQRMNAS